VLHVSARAAGGSGIFDLPMARRRYVIYLARACKRYQVRLLFFVVMLNHVHLLIWGPSPGISRAIQLAHSRVATWVNEVTAGQGHVFQARFDGREVKTTRYLVQLLRYLARNPVVAGVADSASKFTWSADRYYRNGRISSIIDLRQVERLTTLAADSAAYARLVDGPAPAASQLEGLRQELIEQALVLGVTPEALRRGRDPVVASARERLIKTWLAAGVRRALVVKVLGISRSAVSRQAR